MVAFDLREHKYISRKLFLAWLLDVHPAEHLRKCIYVGFGGPTLEDHRYVNQELGMSNLVSLESDEKRRDRQEFNRPIDSVHCLNLVSTDFVAQVDVELSMLGMDVEASRITWLDFMAPADRLLQLRDWQSLLNSSNSGDIVRITINAHARSLGEASYEGQSPEEMRNSRLDSLRRQLGDWIPAGITQEHMKQRELPGVLSRCIQKATREALDSRLNREFVLGYAESYEDGQQMLSVTGIVLDRNGEEFEAKKELISRRVVSWPDWTSIIRLAVPHLSIRERLLFDQIPSRTPEDQLKALFSDRFGSACDLALEDFKRYKEFHREYPHFHHVNY